jgi:hypothetical protein
VVPGASATALDVARMLGFVGYLVTSRARVQRQQVA